jgi:putative spermidine/putrescine transport system substrate-binding protein
MFSLAKSRRRITCLTTLGSIAACVAACDGTQNSKSSPTSITMVSYGGGAYQESHKTALAKPFELYTGVNVQSTTWNAEYGKLKSMVESGQVPWDVVDVTAAQFKRGKSENLFSALTVAPESDDFIPGTVDTFGVGNVYWGTVLAYRKDKFSSSPPKTWEDFFDVNKYPGPRALYDDPRGNLEFALLADGVPTKKLYPLDVDRAFRKLSTIKAHIRVWWQDGSGPIQYLTTNQVAISSAWNGRIFASDKARSEIGYSWNGAALELDYWIVPKGSRQVDASSRFIAYASSAPAMGKQATMIGYGPVNRASLRYVDENARVQLPTFPPNWDAAFVVDAEWWSANEQTIKTRWLAWKAQ